MFESEKFYGQIPWIRIFEWVIFLCQQIGYDKRQREGVKTLNNPVSTFMQKKRKTHTLRSHLVCQIFCGDFNVVRRFHILIQIFHTSFFYFLWYNSFGYTPFQFFYRFVVRKVFNKERVNLDQIAHNCIDRGKNVWV